MLVKTRFVQIVFIFVTKEPKKYYPIIIQLSAKYEQGFSKEQFWIGIWMP